MPGKPERVREVVFFGGGAELARVKLCDCPAACVRLPDVIAEHPDGRQEVVDAFSFHGELVGGPPEWMVFPEPGDFASLREQPECDLVSLRENGVDISMVSIVTWSMLSEERTVRGVFPIKGVFAGHCHPRAASA